MNEQDNNGGNTYATIIGVLLVGVMAYGAYALITAGSSKKKPLSGRNEKGQFTK